MDVPRKYPHMYDFTASIYTLSSASITLTGKFSVHLSILFLAISSPKRVGGGEIDVH